VDDSDVIDDEWPREDTGVFAGNSAFSAWERRTQDLSLHLCFLLR
jgi:hypothetical protein